VAEVSPVELRRVHDGETLARIRAGMDKYAILVFRDQPFSDDEQLAFAQRLDGQLHARTGSAALGKSRLGNEALSDISNVDESGALLKSDDRRRMYGLGNRLWHTDASFQDPPGRYSMLSARIIPWPVPEGRLLLRDLIEHATQPEFVYRHGWRVGDLVIWDNRATMHRARPFDDAKYRRELRRVTTLDIAEPAPVARGAP